MRKAILTAKHCPLNAMFEKKIILSNPDLPDKFDAPVPFKIGLVREDNKYEYNVPNIRTNQSIHTLFTFRDLGFRVGDKITFDRHTWHVESVGTSYYESTKFKLIKQYFITVK